MTDTIAPLLIGGLVVFAAGFAVVFAGARPGARVAGFLIQSVGAVTAIAAARPAGPAGSWAVAVTVALTLAPLLVIALALARKLDALTMVDPERSGAARASLDDEPR